MPSTTDLCFGRQAATRPVGYRDIFHYATSLPEAPATFDHTNGFDGFHMLGNGPDPSLTVGGGAPKGDCAFVGTVNTVIIDQVETSEPLTMPSSNLVVTSYDTYDHGQDLGANLSQLLAFQYKTGLPWLKGAPYAGLSVKDLDEFWVGTNAFGCSYIGIVVTEAMMTQTQNGEPWDLTGTSADNNILGGHCVVTCARNGDGGEVATWGQRQKFTTRWFKKNVEEAHVLITPAQMARKGNGYGIAEDELAHDLTSLAA